MDLFELFQQDGLGVMATASTSGCVNTAIYARPHVIDKETMVWGMTEGRTYRNVIENPQATFLFKVSGPGFRGVRLNLQFMKAEDYGPMLEKIKEGADVKVGPGTGMTVTHAVWFRVGEIRPLV